MDRQLPFGVAAGVQPLLPHHDVMIPAKPDQLGPLGVQVRSP